MKITLDTQAMQALIDRVEAAEGPDRDLDAAIDEAIGFAVERPCDPISRANWPQRVEGFAVPRYTASLDAAVAEAMRHGFIAALGDLAFDGLPGCGICTGTAPLAEAWGVSRAGTDPVGRLARAATAAALSARLAKERGL